MLNMRIVKQDILTGIDTTDKPTVVLHGCNCLHTMGAGIAKYFNHKYPQVLVADKTTRYGDRSKLGTYSTAIIREQVPFHILNCYTQFDYRGPHGRCLCDYRAIQRCLNKVAQEYQDWEIRLPMIGCGLARGSWDVVSDIFTKELNNCDYTVYYK